MQWSLDAALEPLAVLALAAGLVGALLRERRMRRRAEARNRAILASIGADLAVITQTGVLELCNDNWSRTSTSPNPFTCGRPGESWIAACGDPPAENRGDLARIREALDTVLSAREIERLIEYTWQAADGHRWSHLRVQRLLRPGGGAVVAHVDVTQRKRIEADAHKALHELAHMNIRAGMGEVVSTVTHELNQPLTASLGNVQALKRILAANRLTHDELQPIIDDIGDATRRAADVMGRIRSLMRKDDFDVRPLNLNGVVTDVVQILSAPAANDGVLLVADLDPALPTIAADRVQLRQVVMNLVLNAVQASRDHGAVPPIVRVATAAQNGSVSLIVEDAGPGVGEDALARLFEPYFTTKHEGLGVGLSISRSIVESHGGTIGVANLPQRGARFRVTLPLPEPILAPSPASCGRQAG